MNIPDGMDLWVSDYGQKLIVHSKDNCSGACAIHNPSNHAAKDWKRFWRYDRGLMERMCPEHNVGHPDYDHMRYLESLDARKAYYEGIHGCCGCYHGPLDNEEADGVE